MEDKSNLKELKEFYRKFTKDRDWDKYHKPKDLSIAISIEAGELQEHFLWKTDKEITAMLKNKSKKEKVVEELADVFAYTVRLADKMDVDLIEAFYDKMKKNAKKYPVEKIKGKFRKYTEI